MAKVTKKTSVKKSTKSVSKTAEPKLKTVKVTKKSTPPEEVMDLPLPSEEKMEVITQFQVKDGDTGSPEVQVALLTKRIDKLVLHLKGNPGDNHSRRGLLGIVSKRRRLLNYLESKDKERYKGVVKKLGLSK